jgi:hypothetical protein
MDALAKAVRAGSIAHSFDVVAARREDIRGATASSSAKRRALVEFFIACAIAAGLALAGFAKMMGAW